VKVSHAGWTYSAHACHDDTEVLYKTTDFWAPAAERSIRWNDPDLGLPWPMGISPILAAKDAAAPTFANAEVFE
jgi:dTDP-4-dehydrorhamnose 3,5-epimerase